MEMPFHLKTLPPEALEILRFYGQQGSNIAQADDICDATGLSERGFGKAIRRLVTKNYLTMDGGQRYRLSDSGQRAVNDLMASIDEDTEFGRADDEYEDRLEATAREVVRRIILAVPEPLVADQAVNVFVGFDEPDSDNLLDNPITLILKLSVLNGEPESPMETPFLLDNDERRRDFEITPGKFTRARVRLSVYHLDDATGDSQMAGGMYVDADVLPPGSAGADSFAAYGANVRFTITG